MSAKKEFGQELKRHAQMAGGEKSHKVEVCFFACRSVVKDLLRCIVGVDYLDICCYQYQTRPRQCSAHVPSRATAGSRVLSPAQYRDDHRYSQDILFRSLLAHHGTWCQERKMMAVEDQNEEGKDAKGKQFPGK